MNADDATWAMTHLWWLSDRTPEIDPYSPDQSKLDANRARVLQVADGSCPATASRSASSGSARRVIRAGR